MIRRRICCFLWPWLVLSCAETGQDHVSVELAVRGTDAPTPVDSGSGSAITLSRAELAFGPLYLCPGATAGELCETARAEWLDTIVVDLLDTERRSAGELIGSSGPLLSYMYDLGISSQLTRSEPTILPAAAELGDASLVLEGRAVVDGIELPFSLSLALQQTTETEIGVPIVRKSSSEFFQHELTPSDESLTVTFDATPWVRSLDLSPYVTRDSCQVDGPARTCDRTELLNCEGGVEVERQDCATSDQICVVSSDSESAVAMGTAECVDEVTIEPGSEAYRSVRNAVLSGSRPTFTWR